MLHLVSLHSCPRIATFLLFSLFQKEDASPLFVGLESFLLFLELLTCFVSAKPDPLSIYSTTCHFQYVPCS